jgi:hypothetical protein
MAAGGQGRGFGELGFYATLAFILISLQLITLFKIRYLKPGIVSRPVIPALPGKVKFYGKKQGRTGNFPKFR